MARSDVFADVGLLTNEPAPLAAGQKVMARHSDGEWCEAVVETAHADGSADVRYPGRMVGDSFWGNQQPEREAEKPRGSMGQLFYNVPCAMCANPERAARVFKALQQHFERVKQARPGHTVPEVG